MTIFFLAFGKNELETQSPNNEITTANVKDLLSGRYYCILFQ